MLQCIHLAHTDEMKGKLVELAGKLWDSWGKQSVFMRIRLDFEFEFSADRNLPHVRKSRIRVLSLGFSPK